MKRIHESIVKTDARSAMVRQSNTVFVAIGLLIGVIAACGSDAKQTDERALFGDHIRSAVELKPGLNAEFFYFTQSLAALPNLSGLTPAISRTDATINYPSTNSSWSGLPTIMADTFSSRHTGFLRVPSAGTYRLYLNSDDGSRLWLDGRLVIDNDGLHLMNEVSGQVNLSQGDHSLRVEFFENYGGAGLVMSWSGPNIDKQVVPTSALFQTPDGTGADTSYELCADEGGYCAFSGTITIRYGNDSVYFEKSLSNGTNCTNDVFGDPLYGTFKHCYKPVGGTTPPASPHVPEDSPRTRAFPKLILHEVPLGVPSTSPNNWSNADVERIDALPFSGMVFNTNTSVTLMHPNPGYELTEAMVANEIAPAARLKNLKTNFLLIIGIKTLDWFDSDADWDRKVFAKWRMVARASRAAGLAGIAFDNEEYLIGEAGSLWVTNSSPGHSFEESQQQARLRGEQLMKAVSEEWPSVHFLVFHGPYVSDPNTPACVLKNRIPAMYQPLSGFFFSGLLQSTPASALLIDGGEIYSYRTAPDFDCSYQFRKNEFASDSFNSLVIPPALRAKWRQSLSISFGLFDDDLGMNPSLMKGAVEESLLRADEYVWFYSEDHAGAGSTGNILMGTQPQSWLDAVKQGVDAARARWK